METKHIVALLVGERNRLDAAIHALQNSTERRGRALRQSTLADPPAAPVARKRKISATGRKAMAAAARRRWAAIKAGKAPNPFAKAKGKTIKKG